MERETVVAGQELSRPWILCYAGYHHSQFATEELAWEWTRIQWGPRSAWSVHRLGAAAVNPYPWYGGEEPRLERYIKLVEQEKESRPSESLLVTEILRLRDGITALGKGES